jgi:outer membrane receptor protein involved in Fe transport
MNLNIHAAVRAALLLACVTAAHAAETETLTEVVVTAPYGQQIARDRVPSRVQTATTDDIAGLQPLDITELLNRGFGSVSINHAQNNPLQPDVNFRGQTASPLLGLAQGLSVYANGVRMNETFGDTVNWDLLPLSAVQSVQLLAGTNPVFGLNSLGGALSLTMKDGFNAAGTAVEGFGGSFGRIGSSLQTGGNNGTWGWYGDLDFFEEDGWRDFSHSDALRGYGALSWRQGADSFDLSYAHADSSLRGNGSSPIELLDEDRKAVFTWPDQTDNKLNQLIATGSKSLGNGLTLAGNAFFRKLQTDSFNGDGTIFEECDIGGEELLVDEEFDDVNDDGQCTGVDDYELVLDGQGEAIEAEQDGEELNAVNNISSRDQKSYGASVQLGHELELGNGRRNTLNFGASWQSGKANFDSVVEVAALTEERGTTRTGILADDYGTNVDSRVTTWSLYAADTFDITTRLSLTAAARYDHTRVTLEDQSGLLPDLNGRHNFGRVNPAIGLTWRGAHGLLVYGNLSQASRAPTAVELACADEQAPCNLPNAFLADPPLKEVVARSIEVGVRGTVAGLGWQFGVYQTVNKDDILFQTTGGALANEGFFQNVSDTRRRGIELSLQQDIGSLSLQFDYTLVDATFRDGFIVNSPNHPLFGDDADEVDGADLIVGDGKLLVESGSTLPGIARHQANLGLDYKLGGKLRLGADVEYRSGVYLRGDEINVLGRTDSYALLNLHGEYRFTDSFSAFARIENLLNEKYETFGLLGEPDEVFEDFEDPRFYGAGPPRGAWIGARYRF